MDRRYDPNLVCLVEWWLKLIYGIAFLAAFAAMSPAFLTDQIDGLTIRIATAPPNMAFGMLTEIIFLRLVYLVSLVYGIYVVIRSGFRVWKSLLCCFRTFFSVGGCAGNEI